MKRIVVLLFVLLFGFLQTNYAQNEKVDWEQKGKVFLRLLEDGKYGQAISRCDSVMKKHLDEKRLAKLWTDLKDQMGAFQSVVRVKVEETGVYHRVNVICRFDAGKFNILVVFNAREQVAGLWFLPVNAPKYEIPTYVDTTAFYEEQVKFGQPDWQLPGVLSIPRNGSQFPAVVLVHGSGPNDRDETIGPNRPFRDLAWGLASRGILVFRYDKRTKVYGPRMTGKAITVENEVIEDALSAVQLVRKRADVDQKKIFVLGHSLGAMLAPEIGSRSKGIAGIVMLAAPASTLEDVISYQLPYLEALKPATSEKEKKQLDSLLTLLKKIKNETLPDTVKVMGASASYYYDLHRRNQVMFAKSLKIPCLLLQGGRDYQVRPDEFKIWQKELAGHTNCRFISYPALNHLFMAGEGKSTPAEYMDQQRHVFAQVILDIATWIHEIK
ncbi:MAG TPA: alpha/beta fold hydrolase [Bacteroidetes bacterium]|nr:alpha/beta fold hydrolase [Bacteroidota bacterium]